MDGSGSDAFLAARKEFWERIERKAHSREAMRRRFADAGHRVSVQSIGGWVRGEVDPGFGVTALAARLWNESIDAVVHGEPEEQRLRDQVAELLRRQAELDRRLGDIEGALRGWEAERAGVRGASAAEERLEEIERSITELRREAAS
jgi:hypothetical protein